MIITTLLLPLGHIPFSLPLALEAMIWFKLAYITPMASRCHPYALLVVNLISRTDTFRSVCICMSLRLHASLILK